MKKIAAFFEFLFEHVFNIVREVESMKIFNFKMI